MLAVSLLPIVLGVLAALVVLLFAGGLIANARRNAVLARRLSAEIDAADAALAEARAQDRGWERAALEAAAREAFSARHAGQEVRELHLVRVIDRPGTDADVAVFHVVTTAGSEATITLGRRDGAWVAADRA